MQVEIGNIIQQYIRMHTAAQNSALRLADKLQFQMRNIKKSRNNYSLPQQ